MTNLDELLQMLSDELRPLALLPDGSLQLRIAANKFRRVLDQFDPPKPPDPLLVMSLLPMTDAEAKQFETNPMAYGKHAGTPTRDVPRDYLEWLADAKRSEWREMHRYLLRTVIAAHGDNEPDEPTE